MPLPSSHTWLSALVGTFRWFTPTWAMIYHPPPFHSFTPLLPLPLNLFPPFFPHLSWFHPTILHSVLLSLPLVTSAPRRFSILCTSVISPSLHSHGKLGEQVELCVCVCDSEREIWGLESHHGWSWLIWIQTKHSLSHMVSLFIAVWVWTWILRLWGHKSIFTKGLYFPGWIEWEELFHLCQNDTLLAVLTGMCFWSPPCGWLPSLQPMRKYLKGLSYP